jgi:hypothetical protein
MGSLFKVGIDWDQKGTGEAVSELTSATGVRGRAGPRNLNGFIQQEFARLATCTGSRYPARCGFFPFHPGGAQASCAGY